MGIKTYFLLAFATLFTGLTPDKELYSLKIISGKSEWSVKPYDEIEITKGPFTLEFSLPKAKMESITLQVSTNPKAIKAYEKGTPIDSLEQFGQYKAMSVKVNAYVPFDNSLTINNDANQPFMYNGDDFTSFHSKDSIGDNYLFQFKVDEFLEIDGDDKNEFKVEKAPFKKLYILAKFDINKDGWTDIGVIPFVLKFKKR